MTAPLTAAEVAEGMALAAKATEAPWQMVQSTSGGYFLRHKFHKALSQEVHNDNLALIVFLRNHADALLAAAQENARLREALADTERERDNWIEGARQFANGSDFYRGLVAQIGDLFGVAARTADDGSVADSVIALRVPELVAAALAATPAPERPYKVIVRPEHDEVGSMVHGQGIPNGTSVVSGAPDPLAAARQRVVDAARVWNTALGGGMAVAASLELEAAVDALAAAENGEGR